ncbi:hypothetical protein EDD16DRAFT_1636774 [Pisolithus croceorrhizus]|nr:hypothetical protein EDD16DRAFT_1636774 [Pisolithus croceorrhizus]
MDKRAAIYSHRPRMPMLIDLIGNSWVVSVISGEQHRERRSIAQRYFLGQFKDWQHVQLKSSRTFLRNLFDDPDNWVAFLPFSGMYFPKPSSFSLQGSCIVCLTDMLWS